MASMPATKKKHNNNTIKTNKNMSNEWKIYKSSNPTPLPGRGEAYHQRRSVRRTYLPAHLHRQRHKGCVPTRDSSVGAEGRMEMQRVPDAGYRIIGLPVAGFDRKHSGKNFSVLLKLILSQWKARSIIRSSATSSRRCRWLCQWSHAENGGMMGIPTLIQEQNSYAGVTVKVGTEGMQICVAYEGMETLSGRKDNHDR